MDNVSNAIDKIGSLAGVEVAECGGIYETEPQGIKKQRWFVNTAISVETTNSPEELLKKLQAIEKSMGRVRGGKDGPRIIDIDIIFYGDVVMDTDSLTIPHPEAMRRRFVLKPLADIDERLANPVTGERIEDALGRLSEEGQGMRRVSL